MLRCPGLPLLPGSTFRDITKFDFRLSHHWEYSGGKVPIEVESQLTQPGIHDVHIPPSVFMPYIGPKLPPWLAYDKKVLCFHGYYKEALDEVYKSCYQIRVVKFLYYLEDGTLQISEPRIPNSGIPQGCLVSRQRVPKPKPCHNEFISISDLNVNKFVQIYDRVYHITGCDPFTRKFLNRLGIPVPDPIEIEKPPTKRTAPPLPKKPSNTVDVLGKFLENDRKVLRFYAYWDDRPSKFGDVRDLIIYYFLADDTLEIKEIVTKNAGRDAGALFLRRAKLPKDFTGLHDFGANDPLTILNVISDTLKDGRYIADRLGVGSQDIQYYQDRDLAIGSVINVYGRAVTITDCDEFTKEYYRKKFGIESFPSISKPHSYECSTIVNINDRELPPYNGYGSYEDSEGNCKTVEPKPPFPDFKKFIEFDGYSLRFGATMRSKFKENTERLFVITYYLSDDTISVYEFAVRNSGFVGGDFFKRSKFVLPNQEVYTSNRPREFEPHHFYVGAQVILKDFTFFLTVADEFTLCYMEKKPNQFHFSNSDMIMNKIREAIRPMYKDFIAKYLTKLQMIPFQGCLVEMMSFNDIECFLIELLGENIVEQEIITICRKYSCIEKKSSCNREIIRSAIHMEIKREIWGDVQGLREYLYHICPANNGYVTQDILIKLIRGTRLPLDVVLVQNLISVLERDCHNNIKVDDFLSMIDVTIPSCPIPPQNIKRNICDQGQGIRIKFINWNLFIKELGFEENLRKEAD